MNDLEKLIRTRSVWQCRLRWPFGISPFAFPVGEGHGPSFTDEYSTTDPRIQMISEIFTKKSRNRMWQKLLIFKDGFCGFG